MAKQFEDYFAELQADMVEICLEYAEERAETIYIYCSFEQNALTSNFFYRINGLLVKKNKLNDAVHDGKKYDTSIDRQRIVIKEINKDIEKMNGLCEKYNKPMLAEMKIVYDVQKHSMKADYRYDPIHSVTEDKSAMLVCDEWFELLKIEEGD